MSKNKKTANDRAWETLFETHNILEEVDKNGCFEIESAQINKLRESRLMAKFDHSVNLPDIFRENHLSILPISRSKYVIGKFRTHFDVKYDPEIEVIPFDFPSEIESIDYTNLYSESSALHCAFNIGIIDDLLGEKTACTVSGRMSTESFDFNIINSTTNIPYSIKVKNSQCEIDAGFESNNYFVLIEAKNYSIEDFLIRQLYYPYRLWSKKITKKVIPVLMTYSNDVFSFFIYEFSNDENYNSLKLREQRNYTIAPQEIQQSDVDRVFNNIRVIAEPDVPLPQADKFERVVDLLSLLLERNLTKDDITENYEFDRRQTDYYTNAGLYIGLIEKYQDSLTNKVAFRLTSEGRSILQKRPKLKYLDLINKILERQVFYLVFQLALKLGEIPPEDAICKIISENRSEINDTTIKRRNSTVRGWISWIWFQIKD
ncbi:translation elongation factor [Tychonema sp. LEGE 07203]|uniref:type II restriction enzyme n=1 Tax=Tychonema sp. LEGE 07203 TaxID=1828671 RepID=UPI0018826F86|nr:translation elongation factor [Tychonema sp. LEGE 07203]MBE9094856.1 translation elongation factor [Tychonema sp. LEGE 07203]